MNRECNVILLIEDDAIPRLQVTDALESAGFEVRSAAGPADLETKLRLDGGFLDGIDLMVLDMVLVEIHERQREDKSGSHEAMAMTGSQMGATMGMSYPSLRSVPFIIYSAKQATEIQAHLAELIEFAECDDYIKDTYKGFITKHPEGASEVLARAVQVLSP